MPNIISAKKRAKQTAVKQKRNYAIRSKVHTSIKKIEKLVHDKKLEEAQKAVPEAYKEIDLAVKKNILHRNTGARRKSRVARMVVNPK